MVRFRYEEDDESKHAPGPDKKRIKRPAPVSVSRSNRASLRYDHNLPRSILVDEATDYRANLRPKEWTSSVYHHRSLKFVACEKVTNSTSSHTEKGTSDQAINKACDKHGLDVLCHCTWYDPNQEQYERDNINGTATVKLNKSVMRHNAQL